jgi:predicted ferric reductase
LAKIRRGNKVWVEGPYGRFYSDVGKQVWVAGGIGITPFLSMAEELPNSRKDVDLYYSVTKRKELVVIDDLRSIQKLSKGRFRVHEWVSDEMGRLGIEAIKGPYAGKAYFLCGPPGLKDSIKRGLLEKGVRRSMIMDEEFRFK